MLNSIGFNTLSPVKYNLGSKNVPLSKKSLEQNNSDLLINSLNCMGAISFGSLQSSLNKLSLKGLEKFISNDLSSNNIAYGFLLRNPKGFYLESGRDVNKFLRSGSFDNIPEITDGMSQGIRQYMEAKIADAKDFNRAIVESINIFDSKFTSKTTEPMTVYRDAPRQWMNTAKNGILTDAAYLSTSTERGASMEGIICNGADNFTYEIRLPTGTPFWDLTDTAEKEMLLQRGGKYKIIGNGVLELIR